MNGFEIKSNELLAVQVLTSLLKKRWWLGIA